MAAARLVEGPEAGMLVAGRGGLHLADTFAKTLGEKMRHDFLWPDGDEFRTGIKELRFRMHAPGHT